MFSIPDHIQSVIARNPNVELYGDGMSKSRAFSALRLNENDPSFEDDLNRWKWVLNLQAGDLINGCTTWPYNSIVDRIQVRKSNPNCHKYRNPYLKSHRGWVVDEVSIYTTDGRHHVYPGGGCVDQPYTEDEIREVLAGSGAPSKDIYLQWIMDNYEGDTLARRIKEYELALVPGSKICDERGCKILSEI